ncbi:hypothetical protein LPJ59_004803 [Coemansia sp. RSA 2399]|nr:hypothetical protein LPJ59_004803 [Coemansia sp. RSA 2399]
MPDPTTVFEAMMASITAPPLSLYEFRLFISNDPKAQNALAFCEWYQRYKTVYFDRVIANSEGQAIANAQPELSSQYATTKENTGASNSNVHAGQTPSRASFSVPNFGTRMHNSLPFGAMHTLKSHSFSVLSESVVDSAFHASTTSTGYSSVSAGRPPLDSSITTWNPDIRLVGPINYCAEGDGSGAIAAHAINPPYTSNMSTILRRRTLPPVPNKSWLEHSAQTQERNRLQIQSLLIFECWARFLSSRALEKVDIPEAESLYVQERLPLNITHMPQPLLCRNDMLTSTASIAAARAGSPSQNNGSSTRQRYNLANLSEVAAPLRLAPCRSLQFEPQKQLKQRLISRVNMRQLDFSLTQSPISLGFGVSSADSDLQFTDDSASVNDDSVKQFITGLRRISTMPALKLQDTLYKTTCQDYTSPPIQQRGLSAPRAVRLIPVTELQMYHRTLRPQPPLSTWSASAHACGYKPVPLPLCKLISPNAIPPAVFDTIAKISATYLLQTYFAEFYRQAHHNTTSEERIVLFVAAVLAFLSGFGIAAVLVILNSSKAWRAFSLPFLFTAPVLACAAWTRVSIWRWWMCSRATGLISRHCQFYKDTLEEKALQTDNQTVDAHLRAIRIITGTFLPHAKHGYSGAVFGTNSHMYNSLYFETADGGSNSADNTNATTQHPEPWVAVSSLSLWSQASTCKGVVDSAVDAIIRLKLRRYRLEDRWNINLEKKRYNLADPTVLRGQCYIVVHQLAVITIFCAVSAITLFLIPSYD